MIKDVIDESAEEIELWSIADDNSKDAIEEMSEKLGETQEWVKEYMGKITLEDIHEAFQDFRDAMVATKGCMINERT